MQIAAKILYLHLYWKQVLHLYYNMFYILDLGLWRLYGMQINPIPF